MRVAKHAFGYASILALLAKSIADEIKLQDGGRWCRLKLDCLVTHERGARHQPCLVRERNVGPTVGPAITVAATGQYLPIAALRVLQRGVTFFHQRADGCPPEPASSVAAPSRPNPRDDGFAGHGPLITRKDAEVFFHRSTRITTRVAVDHDEGIRIVQQTQDRAAVFEIGILGGSVGHADLAGRGVETAL